MTRLRFTSPLQLPPVGADALPSSPAAAVFVEPPGGERTFLRYAPAFIDDPAGTGMFNLLGEQRYVSPPAVVTTIPDAMLFGYRGVAWQDRFCMDEALSDAPTQTRFLTGLASADPFPNEDTGLLPTDNPAVFDLPEDRPRRHIHETAVVLCSHEPSNYGSFLFRVLPKLHAVRRYGLGGFRMVVWGHTPAFRELLAVAGVPEAQIIQHDTHAQTTFDRVLAPSLRNPHAFLDGESHALFQDIARAAPDAGSGRRLYISRLGQARRGASTRQMTNEAEVVAMVQRLGFEVIEPETLTPAEQISTFAAAGMVVGPSGSAMFNTVFCRPGTKIIDIESEPHWIYAHTGLFASCQAQYGIFVGQTDAADPAPVHRRFTVDVPALEARIVRFLHD